MAKAIWTTRSGLTLGLSQLGRHGDGRGSPIQQVHDGDTIIVEAAGNLSVRLLGIDTPEVSFTLPETGFRVISGEDWVQFLNDPFSGAPQAFLDSLDNGLLPYLQGIVGSGGAANHAHHDQSILYLAKYKSFSSESLSN